MKLFVLFSFLIVLFHHPLYAQHSKYEFRGVWIATVENIDFPSKKNMLPEEQKAEFIRILNMHYYNGLNAVIVQIRPAADAFYESPYEPWSQYLTGVQGKAPYPFYDPLSFMIEETHKRGMEFHAWVNPYRAVFNVKRSSISPNHITRKKPDWFVTYGNTKYFDPANKEARLFVAEVVKDIVKRYDVDAIHMDDYFYPYKIAGKEFPDQQNYLRLGKGMTKADWRRSNCDSIVHLISNSIKKIKPAVKFGISPFGIWRNNNVDPKGSATKGLSNYDDLYADVLLWLQKGWIDYIAPQLYWEIGHATCDFETLTSWWNDNAFGKQLYIGHGLYKAYSNTSWRNPNELPNQIKATRNHANVDGSVFYSSNIFNKNPLGWNDSLQNNYYKKRALIKPVFNKDSVAVSKPVIDFSNVHFDGENLGLNIKNISSKVRNYAIYYSTDNRIDINDEKFLLTVVPAYIINHINIKLPKLKTKVARYLKITAVSTTNHESTAEDLVLLK